MRLLDELRREGYRVDGAMFLAPDERPTVFYVAGYGVGLYVAKDDLPQMASLLSTHRERARRRQAVARMVVALDAIRRQRDSVTN